MADDTGGDGGPGQGRRSRQLSPHLSCSGSTAAEAIVPAARALSSIDLPWVAVEGNPRLWWLSTPVTYVHIGRPGGDLPVTGLMWHEAHALAIALGSRLPTTAEWERMAAGLHGRRYPWGDQEWTPQHANLRGSGFGQVVPVGQFPVGATPDSLLDVAGNVWEWTADRLAGHGAIVLGGSYNSLPRYAECGYRNDVPAALASPGIGLRVVRDR